MLCLYCTVVADEIPDYYDIVKQPMDFSTVKKKLEVQKLKQFILLLWSMKCSKKKMLISVGKVLGYTILSLVNEKLFGILKVLNTVSCCEGCCQFLVLPNETLQAILRQANISGRRHQIEVCAIQQPNPGLLLELTSLRVTIWSLFALESLKGVVTHVRIPLHKKGFQVTVTVFFKNVSRQWICVKRH